MNTLYTLYYSLTVLHVLVLCVTLFDGTLYCTLALQVNLVLCIDQPKRQTGGHLLLLPPGQTSSSSSTKKKTTVLLLVFNIKIKGRKNLIGIAQVLV